MNEWCWQCDREHEAPGTHEGPCWFAERHRFLDFKPVTVQPPHFLTGLANVFYGGDLAAAQFALGRGRGLHLARVRREAEGR